MAGKSTKITGSELRDYIARIETVREDKKELAELEKAIFGEAKAAGYDTKTLRKIIAFRALEPGERDEQQAILDTYLHAIGMKRESPLVAAADLISVDLAVREQLIEAWKKITPATGEIIVRVGGAGVRLFRDEKGEAQAEDVIEPERRQDPPEGLQRARTSKAVQSLIDLANERAKRAKNLKLIQGGKEPPPPPKGGKPRKPKKPKDNKE